MAFLLPALSLSGRCGGAPSGHTYLGWPHHRAGLTNLKEGTRPSTQRSKRPPNTGEDSLNFLSHLLLEGLIDFFILQQVKDILRD